MQPTSTSFLEKNIMQLEPKKNTNLLSGETFFFGVWYWYTATLPCLCMAGNFNVAPTSRHFSVVSPTGKTVFAIFGRKESWWVTKAEKKTQVQKVFFWWLFFCEVLCVFPKVWNERLEQLALVERSNRFCSKNFLS